MASSSTAQVLPIEFWQRPARPPVAPVDHTPLDRLLSPRELEIAGLVADGMANKEIGLTLGISHWTVSAHLRRIFVKLEIGRRMDLCLLYRGAEPDRPPYVRSG